MAPLKFLIAVALAGLLLWLQVCNKFPMVNALCQVTIIRCARPLAVQEVMCSHENADAICQQRCRLRGTGFYSDQDCCRTDGLCCCLPVYPTANDDDHEGESSSQPNYRASNNLIDYIGSPDDGNDHDDTDNDNDNDNDGDGDVDYRQFDSVDGLVDDEVSESSQALVGDQGENSSPPNDNGDGENS